MESFAILLVSIAMLMQMIALFRPASGRCCSVKALALAGGIIMAAYAFLQMVAFVLVIVMEKEYDDGEIFICRKAEKRCSVRGRGQRLATVV